MEPNEEKKEEKTEETPNTIKIDGKEYSQEEVQELVGLGQTAKEYETKWNRPIGEFYPDYTQKSQKLSEYEKAEKARLEEELSRKQAEGNLTPEEQRALVIKQAKDYGLLTKEDLDNEVTSRVANLLRGNELVKEVESIAKQAKTDGKPSIKADELLQYMDETGIKDPSIAYEIKFRNELREIEAQKLNGIKQPGLDTSSESTAGGKAPPQTSAPTRDTLAEAIKNSLNRRAGGGA